LRITAVTWRDLPNQSAGGAEVVIDRLLTGLTERGHHVTLVCGGPVADHEYRTVKAGGTFSQYLLAPIICMTKLRRSEVIIDAENGFPYFSPVWRRRPLVCLVHHVHTDQWHGRFPPLVAAACQILESRLMPVVYRNHIFVAASDSTADSLRSIGVRSDQIRIIEPGVDVPAGPLGERSEEPLFISLSRLVPHKRVGLILDAWRIASREMPGRLVILGDGPDFMAIRRRAASIPRVEVRGHVPEEVKRQLLAQAWGIVTATHHEGWGISLMEAAAVGTPALGVDAPGIRDAIVNGVTGVLVEGPDEVLAAALAAAWVTFVSDEATRQKMGQAARDRAAQFTWDTTIDRWLNVLEEVTDSNSRSRRRGSCRTPPT